jgi:hypothetical protein
MSWSRRQVFGRCSLDPLHVASGVQPKRNEGPLAQSEDHGPTGLVPLDLGHRQSPSPRARHGRCLLHEKTTFVRIRLGACPPLNCRCVATLPANIFREEDQGSYKRGSAATLEGGSFSHLHQPCMREHCLPPQSQTSRSRVLHRSVARTWVTPCVPTMPCVCVHPLIALHSP